MQQLCTSLCSFVQCGESGCAVLFNGKEIYPEAHFVMTYIFDFYFLMFLTAMIFNFHHVYWKVNGMFI